MDASEAPPSKKPRPHFPKKVKKACANCRRAHSRCDDKRPCSRCVAHLIPHTCDVDSSMVVRNTVSDPVVYAPSLQPSPHANYPTLKRNDEESRRSDPRAISWWNIRSHDQLCLVQCSSKFSEEVLGCPSEIIINRLLLQDLFVNSETVTLITARLDFNIRFGPVEALWNTANGQTKSVLFWCNCKVLSFGTPFDLELGVFNFSETNASPSTDPLPTSSSPFLLSSSSTQDSSPHQSPHHSPHTRSPKSRSPPSRSPPSRSPPRSSHSHPHPLTHQPLSPQPLGPAHLPLHGQPISLYSRPPGSLPPTGAGAPISLFSNPPGRHSAFTASSGSRPSPFIPQGATGGMGGIGASLSNGASLPSSSSSSLGGLSALSESAISELALLSISPQKDSHPRNTYHQQQQQTTPSSFSIFNQHPPSPSPFVLSSHPISPSHNSSPDLSTSSPTNDAPKHRSTIHSLLN